MSCPIEIHQFLEIFVLNPSFLSSMLENEMLLVLCRILRIRN